MEQNVGKKPNTNPNPEGIRILEINLGYSSWYWVHRPDEPSRLRFALHQGLLLIGGKKKKCVGVDLTDRSAHDWLAGASERKRALIRTAKIGAQEDLETLELLPNLEALECNGLTKSELEWVCGLGMPLKCLYLSWCPDLSHISPVSQFPDLLQLSLSDFHNLADLGALKELTDLERLDIINCDDLWDIDPIANAKKLRRLVIRNCENVHRLNAVAMLSQVRQMDLSRSTHVKDLAPLRKLKVLAALDLSNCMRVRDVSPLQNLRSLRILRLFGCSSLRDLRPLYQLPQLKKLSLPNNITDGDFLGLCIGFDGLVQMDLRNCDSVTTIEPISRLVKLEDLSLAGCRRITNIRPLSALKNLVHLDLACCTRITDLTPLYDLENLKDLYIDGCTGLEQDDIDAFEEAMPDCEVHDS